MPVLFGYFKPITYYMVIIVLTIIVEFFDATVAVSAPKTAKITIVFTSIRFWQFRPPYISLVKLLVILVEFQKTLLSGP